MKRRKKRRKRGNSRRSGIFSMKRRSSKGLPKTFTSSHASNSSINTLIRRLSSFKGSLALFKLTVKSKRMFNFKLASSKLEPIPDTSSVKNRDLK